MNAYTLAQADGSVRCDECGKKFNALEFLADERPGPETGPGTVENPPVPVVGATSEDASPGLAGLDTRKDRWTWSVIMAGMVAVTIVNLAWTFREPLLESPFLRQQLIRLGLLEEPAHQPPRLPGEIQLVSRDLHVHPTRAGILVLSAAFVNRSSLPQAWPLLELKLLDSSNRTLALRRFEPSEYLGGTHRSTELLLPETHVPVLLEFADPGALATGFELQFH